MKIHYFFRWGNYLKPWVIVLSHWHLKLRRLFVYNNIESIIPLCLSLSSVIYLFVSLAIFCLAVRSFPNLNRSWTCRHPHMACPNKLTITTTIFRISRGLERQIPDSPKARLPINTFVVGLMEPKQKRIELQNTNQKGRGRSI